jgi:hypothetical protein
MLGGCALYLAQLVLSMSTLPYREAHPTCTWILSALWILLVLLFVLVYFFTYWDLDCTSLRQRKLWKKQEIPWPEVTRVGKLGFTGYIDIRYGHEVESYGSMLADPRHRSDFIDALHQFAPHADFDL